MQLKVLNGWSQCHVTLCHLESNNIKGHVWGWQYGSLQHYVILQNFNGNNLRGYAILQHPSCLSYVEFLHSLMAMLHHNIHQGCVAL